MIQNCVKERCVVCCFMDQWQLKWSGYKWDDDILCSMPVGALWLIPVWVDSLPLAAVVVWRRWKWACFIDFCILSLIDLLWAIWVVGRPCHSSLGCSDRLGDSARRWIQAVCANLTLEKKGIKLCSIPLNHKSQLQVEIFGVCDRTAWLSKHSPQIWACVIGCTTEQKRGEERRGGEREEERELPLSSRLIALSMG